MKKEQMLGEENPEASVKVWSEYLGRPVSDQEARDLDLTMTSEMPTTQPVKIVPLPKTAASVPIRLK